MAINIEEIKTELTEVEFSSRWAILECYHHIGRLIGNTTDNDSLRALCDATGKRKKTILHMVKFAKMFPVLDSTFNEGKNASWNQVVRKYLLEPKETDHDCIATTVCKICRKELSNV